MTGEPSTRAAVQGCSPQAQAVETEQVPQGLQAVETEQVSQGLQGQAMETVSHLHLWWPANALPGSRPRMAAAATYPSLLLHDILAFLSAHCGAL